MPNFESHDLQNSIDLEIGLYGATVLHIACGNGSYDEVIQHLSKGYSPNEPREYDGNTPLHLASASGHWEIVALLLDKGANPNVRNYDGKTCLHIIEKPQSIPTPLFSKFLDKKADCLALNDFIQTLLTAPSWALRTSIKQIPSRQKSITQNPNTILKLYQHKQPTQKINLLKRFIQHHETVYTKSVINFLYTAVEVQAWDIMSLFLDILRLERDQSEIGIPETLWSMVLERKQSRLLNHLLAMSYTPNITIGSLNNTLLHKAVQERDRKCIKTLLLWGANLGTKNDKQITAWQLAEPNIQNYMQTIVHYVQNLQTPSNFKSEMQSIDQYVHNTQLYYHFKDKNEALQWLRFNEKCKWMVLVCNRPNIKADQFDPLLKSIIQLPAELKLSILEHFTGRLAKDIPNTSLYWKHKQSNANHINSEENTMSSTSTTLTHYKF